MPNTQSKPQQSQSRVQGVASDRIRTRGRQQLEVEVALVGWMLAQDKKVF